MDVLKTLFCSSKFLWEGERISSKFIDNLGTPTQKVSPALFRIFSTAPTVWMASIAHNQPSGLQTNRNMAGISISTDSFTFYKVRPSHETGPRESLHGFSEQETW